MTRRATLVGAFTADLVVVVVFAAIGRRSHDESGGATNVLATAAPFLCGLVVAWVAVALGLRARGREESLLLAADNGVLIGLVTTAVGLILRRTLWDRGTAVAFVVVAAAFLTVAMAGWRAARTRLWSRRDDAGSAAS